MNQEELESQLSAMFDGELPATECELLSRRIDRDDNLRGRWSRYALIGAAMRSEPVATARSGFARRVSAALGGRARPGHRRRMLLNTAMAASMVVGVAGLSISMLRNAALVGDDGVAAPILAASTAAPTLVATPSAASAVLVSTAAAHRPGNGEPLSYVTPASAVNGNNALRTDLADFIVAHSQYSMPLMRRSLLSALVSNEDGAELAAPGAPAEAPAGALHAVTAASASSH
ncbi:MAG TPA: sigma-E factor negative regulatory protein [Steroidobacteraceae bacterium]